MFVPVWDMNHLKTIRFQYVTVGLIALTVIVYVVFQTKLFPFADPLSFTGKYAFVPADVMPLVSLLSVRPHLNLVWHMFLHGGLGHLLGNMVFLFVFADNVEDAMGHVRFLLFYVMCGIFAALTYAFMTPMPDTPLIGASGAVSGVIGAYLMLHPNVRVWVLLPLQIVPFLPLRFSAAFVIGVWFVYQFVSAIAAQGTATAWWAHVGGFAAGIILVLFVRRPGVPLFDKATGV